ncbi:MAG TPA: DUF5916 domain-containing protein, partial [Thermoanaerobaculia bacterium]|nr:DUF5916 domain-containing protein [Thermoanaerobaculia bacterium]
LGIQMEAVNSDIDNSEDWSWDIIWESAGRITDSGYEVEVAIPFSQLRFPTTSGPQTWGFLAMRDYPRESRHRLRSTPINRERNCFVCQLESVQGFVGIEQGKHLEMTPTVTAISSDAIDSFPGGHLESVDDDVEAGLSARWSITPNVTLNAAINPDFSQVEADSAQLAVNERFALFFPEKRPFFLEGADLFATQFNLVFTRTVANPIAGLKITGKEGAHAFGLFAAQDELNNVIIPGYQRSRFASLDQEVTSAVARYRKDIGDRSNVGILYTGRVADEYHNHVFSLDGKIQLTDSDTILAQAAHSSTAYPDTIAAGFGQPSDGFDGYAWGTEYRHGDPKWFWRAAIGELSDEFRADSGFTPQVGERVGAVGVERILRGESEQWYELLSIFVGADFRQALEGEADEWGADLGIYFQEGRYELFLGLAPNREYFDGVHYDDFRYSAFASYRPSGDLFVWFEGGAGETIDFTNSQQADFVRLTSGVEFNLGRRLRGEVNHTWQTLDVVAGELFTVNLTEARIFYHLNLRTFVRAILQFQNLDQNPLAYTIPVEPESEDLFSQLLFSYKINPQTVVLIGYSDNYVGLEQVNLTQTNRTFFAKIGYAWLF